MAAERSPTRSENQGDRERYPWTLSAIPWLPRPLRWREGEDTAATGGEAPEVPSTTAPLQCDHRPRTATSSGTATILRKEAVMGVSNPRWFQQSCTPSLARRPAGKARGASIPCRSNHRTVRLDDGRTRRVACMVGGMTKCICQYGEGDAYRCRLCGRCFLEHHTLVTADPPVWRCTDGRKVFTPSNGQQREVT